MLKVKGRVTDVLGPLLDPQAILVTAVLAHAILLVGDHLAARHVSIDSL